MTPKQKDELKAWRKAHRWHPHQLQHNAATEIRRAFGLEAAQLALGHSLAQMTEAVYAERDGSKVAEIMRRVG
jgi:integrase